jgi:Domain of unknown function (DUF6602)
MKLNSTFQKIARQFEIEFSDLTRETEHRQSAGEAREKALVSLLRKYVPARVGVERGGFVIDALGGESRQADIVIYDQTVATIFDIGNVMYFPCEAVLAVGEVKADVTSAATLEDALKKIRSVKALDRSNRGTNKPITGPGISTEGIVSFDPATKHRDQIFGFIFTHSSLGCDTLVRQLQSFLRENPRSHWPNLFCAFGELLITYEKEDGGIYPSAMEANALAVTTPAERDNVLLLFFCILASFLQEAHVARAPYFRYASIESTEVLPYPLA